MEGITFVPTLSIAGMGVSALVAFAAVAAAFLYGRKRLGAFVSSFFIGVGTFILFALVLESLLHNLIYPTALGKKIWGSTWLYALYGGAAAALFEETGRIFAVKTFLRKNNDTPNAFMYGAGHGGIEALYIGVITQISNISLAATINAGKAGELLSTLSGAQYDAAAQQLRALCQTPSPEFYLAGLERVLAIAIHISLSMILFKGLREKRTGLVTLCYALHFTLDAILVLINAAFGAYAGEAFCLVFTSLTVLLALKISPLPTKEEVEA